MADEDQIDEGNDSVRQGKIPDDVLRIIRAAKGRSPYEDIPASTFDRDKVFPTFATAAQEQVAQEESGNEAADPQKDDRPLLNTSLWRLLNKYEKYEFSGETITLDDGTLLHRIRALKDIDAIGVKTGDLGGFVESTDNLSQKDNAWISDNAKVYGNAKVLGGAQIFGSARVYDNAQIFGQARVSDDAQVYGNAWIYGHAKVSGNAEVSGKKHVSDTQHISNNKKKLLGLIPV